MKFTEETLTVLRNFGSINSNIVFNPGNVIKTMSEAKTIMATATIEQEIESQFGIYDLNEFLSVIAMFSDPELMFDPDMKFVKVSEGRRSVKYYFASPSILTTPTKDITMPPIDVSFTLTKDDMADIRKASSTLGVTDVVFTCTPGEAPKLVVTDTKDVTSNSFDIEIQDTAENVEVTCNLIFNINNFKFIQDDFKVSISSKLISRFTTLNSNMEYFVALEKNSTYGV
tara:strand:+ start:1822 stop:2505 length:684 start_codon:yes stop_codon:yes gene_type:complete